LDGFFRACLDFFKHALIISPTWQNHYYKYDQFIYYNLPLPTAIIPQAYNYIINTTHPDFNTTIQLMDVEDYFWDSRLF